MEDLKTYKLGDLVSIQSGGTPNKAIASYWGGNIPWISAKTMYVDFITDSDLYITEEGLKNGSKLAPVGSILLLTRGSGLFNRIPVCMVNNEVAYNQDIKCITVKEKSFTSNLFVFYWLYSHKELLSGILETTGIGAGKIDTSRLLDIDVHLPDLETQHRYIQICSSILEKIEVNKRINDNLEQQAQALFKSWFVDFEPFKDGKFEGSEIGLIPEGWCVGKAEDFYEINIGKTPPRKEHEWFTLDKSQNIWVSISDLGSDSRFLFDSSEYLTDKAIQKHNIVLVPENTVLLSFKLTIGRVGIAGTQLTTNEAIARFITNSVNREYTYFLLKNFNYSKLGSTSSIATAVNSKIIKAMMVLMPNNESLLNFKKLVGPIIDGIKKNEEEILCLTELRDNLLPKLMSGELKINDLDC